MIVAACAVGGAGAVASAQSPPGPRAMAPAAPDYAAARNWAALPGRADAGRTAPPGAAPEAASPQVDAFYIHPTTDRSRGRWNQDLADGAVNRWTNGSVIARQAAIFNGCCRLFAPRYRQATVAAGAAGGAVRDEAFAIAYEDVRRAFRHYLSRLSAGRPFILVGHSQGAAHLERLLAEEIDGKPLQRRLVAAYVVGIGFPVGAFGLTYSSLGICEKPDSTGCAVHWNSILANGDIDSVVRFSEAYNAARLGKGADRQVLCVNPLTFDRARPAAFAGAAKGGVPGTPDESAPAPLVPGAVAARCERGLLVVEPSAALGMMPLVNGSMHYHDLGLFYEDVRENAMVRARAFLRGRDRLHETGK